MGIPRGFHDYNETHPWVHGDSVHQARHGAQLQRSSALLPWISPVHEGGKRGLCAIHQGAAGPTKSVGMCHNMGVSENRLNP